MDNGRQTMGQSHYRKEVYRSMVRSCVAILGSMILACLVIGTAIKIKYHPDFFRSVEVWVPIGIVIVLAATYVWLAVAKRS